MPYHLLQRREDKAQIFYQPDERFTLRFRSCVGRPAVPVQSANGILCKAMQDCFPAGTYYSLAAVQEQLAQAGKSVQRERLGTWIAQTSRMGSACKARRALCAELSGSQYDALMKYQRASGINPVTIGRKWKQRALPSLQSVFGFDE